MTATNRSGARPKKEAIFVQVKNPDEMAVFYDATNVLGQPMPYTNPMATCALRVSDSHVLFTLMRLTKRSRATIAERPLELPRGPLTKLARRAEAFEAFPEPGKVLVEMDENSYTFTLGLDENGSANLELDGDADDPVFELPARAVSLNIFLTSPRDQRLVATSFLGHIGKPGESEGLTRTVAMALNFLTGLAAFRIATGIEAVRVPASAARWKSQQRVRKAEDEVAVSLPVRLWDSAPQPQMLAAGTLGARVDLDTANPVTGRLLFHFTPDATLEPHFDAYRVMADQAVTTLLTKLLGADEVSNLTFGIALGELDERDTTRLREAATQLPGLDLAPTQWMPMPGTPSAG